MSDLSILIIDDDKEIVELIKIYLQNEQFHTYQSYSGSSGLQIMEKFKIDLVILDLMMPDMDGFETCRLIRQKWNLPIIILSAKTQDMDKILGLGIGADDYMTKPFNPMELTARVKSQLRRSLQFNRPVQNDTDASLVQIRDLVLNKKSHKVTLHDQEVNLTKTEYSILLLLAEHPGTVYSTEEIFEQVWQEKSYEANNTVMVHIWRLREKIEENPKEPRVIETVWGVGYKIEA